MLFRSGTVSGIAASGLFTAAVGALLVVHNHRHRSITDRRIAFLYVVLLWFVMALFGTLPFLATGALRSFSEAYFEAMSGTQSQMFHPTHWVDITSVQELKHKACLCHESQGMQPLLDEWHIPMERFRGLECRCAAAEAFALHTDALATL